MATVPRTIISDPVNVRPVQLEQVEQLLKLQKCSRKITSILDLDELIDHVVNDISCAFGKTHGPSGRTIMNDQDFCTALLEERDVACVPGSAFGEPRSIRISYTCPTPELQAGLDRVKAFFAELR